VHCYQPQLKRMQSGSSSWSRHNWGAVAEVDAIMVQFRCLLTRDTTVQGCWCIRVRGCIRLAHTCWRR